MKTPSLTLLALSFLLLTGCSTDQSTQTYGTSSLPPRISLDVQTINLVDRSTQGAPAAVNFDPSITKAIHQWAMDRLQATGREGEATVTIRDASITSQPMPTDDSFGAMFTRQQTTKYVAHASLEISAHRGSQVANAAAEASRWESLPQDPSEAERKDAYYTVLNGLMRDLGKNLEASMQDHMQGFVTAPPTTSPGK